MGDERQRNRQYYAANKERENERCRAYHVANRERRLAIKAAWRDANRLAENSKSVARRRANLEQRLEYERQRRLTGADAEYRRLWRQRNAEREKERLRRWAEENRPRMREKNATRRARKGRATPVWADGDAIAAIYAECVRISVETGFAHEVDHIIPLKGATVCGLHVHQNLRIVAKSVNRSKNNRLEAEFEHSWFPDRPHPGAAEDPLASR